jgi:hypothetical protein
VIDPSEIEQWLAPICAAGPVEVRENGVRVASLAGFQYEIRSHARGTLLHLWTGEQTLVRRVLRITKQSENRLLLEVEHFGRAKPDRLEFASAKDRPAMQLSREKFREKFGDLLRERFPAEEVLSLSAAADLEHSLSSRYTRGIVRTQGGEWAVLAAAPGESADAIDDMLTFGLIWLDHARDKMKSGRLAGLRLFLPEGAAHVVAHRLRALAPSAAIELYGLNLTHERLRHLDAREIGNVVTRLTPKRELEGILAQAQPQADAVRRIAPDAISVNVVPGTRDVALRFRGAEFARWRNSTFFFGLGDHRQPLTPESRPTLLQLLKRLQAYRHPAAADRNHPLYRMQPERWLEMEVAADASRVDARLDPRFLYTQVPAFSAGDRGVIDLLGVTRDGRLAILELKADEDVQLVFQAADYWLRVRRHQQQDDIQRFGYFPGVQLRPDPPLLFLVAPAIRFHPATGALLRHLSSEIEVARVGLAENWRQGLRVVLRQ